jgi:hypothetical protein
MAEVERPENGWLMLRMIVCRDDAVPGLHLALLLLRWHCHGKRSIRRRIARGCYAVSGVSTVRPGFQFHGSSVSSWCRLVRPDTMRSSTSVSQANGSTLFSFADWISVATIAQCRAPLSEPANKAFLRPSAIEEPFCPYQPRCRGSLSLARAAWPQGPAALRRTAIWKGGCRR